MCWATFSIKTLPCVVQSNVDWTYFILGCVCAPLCIWQQHEILLMFQNQCHPWAPLGSAQQSLPFCALGTFFFSHRKKKKRRRKEVRLQGQRIKWANLWKQLPQSSTEQHLWLGTGDICGSGFSSLETPNSRSLSYIFLIFLQKDFKKNTYLCVCTCEYICSHRPEEDIRSPWTSSYR